MSRPQLNPSENNDLEKRIIELENTIKALLKAIQQAEKATGENLMPEGTFSGVTFK